MSACDFEMEVFGGYSDKPTGERVALHRNALVPRVPVKGDYVTPAPGWAATGIRVVFIDLDGLPLVRLEPLYSLADSVAEMVAELEKAGWHR